MLARVSTRSSRGVLTTSVRSFTAAPGTDEKFIAKQQQRIAKLKEDASKSADLQAQFTVAQQIKDIEVETRRYFLSNATVGKVLATTKTPIDTRNHLFFRDPLEVRFAEDIRKYFSSPVYKLAAEIAATNSVPAEKFKALGLPVPEQPNLADVILEAIPKAASLHVQSSDFNEEQRFAEIAKDLEKRLKTDTRYTHLGGLLKKLPQTSYEDFTSWKNSGRQSDPDANLQVLI